MPIALLIAAALAGAAGPGDDPPAVPDAELATMRGGLLLPNGLNVAIGIDIQTRIDGVLALHTIYSSEGPNAGVRVYTDGTTSPSAVPGTVTVATGDPDWPTVSVSRTPTGTTVTAPGPDAPASVNIVAGPATGWLDAAGQTLVPVTANGPAVAASSGSVRLTSDDRGTQVALVTPATEIRHLVGQATGAVIANTGNDRAIDTVSTINVNLVGLPVALMNGVLLVNRIATDAAGQR
ncbi:MAG: hypothetical protein EOP65_09685 [Sphingomonas sp.]|jgi:hypothetical protein|uniref:hypothetical protein n=1 Tax=Sphingomonas sp. CD22 TaxID=3100214 RepID=UPI001204BE87|nr:hypothetical protein [Sphingomonas sp. CD22]MEA1086303.1 hypothetical protein [Sphingomonas sp. CD22]RZL55454.1 MAG: hypothetical protein EOP65_09685 [Sphingomonas sp.]